MLKSDPEWGLLGTPGEDLERASEFPMRGAGPGAYTQACPSLLLKVPVHPSLPGTEGFSGQWDLQC